MNVAEVVSLRGIAETPENSYEFGYGDTSTIARNDLERPMALSRSNSRPCITFLTDFGTRDTYVGQMKGVALGINPNVRLIDLSHDVPPQQILQGAFAWNDAVAAFPSGTIHVGVVDPGVGSDRRLLAAEIGEHRFVCPDNGLLTVILQREHPHRIVRLDNPRWWRSPVSNTFHGRDILTPVAAAWSLGHDLAEFGSTLTTPLVTLPLADSVRGKSSLSGQVIDVDRFGNLITNIESTAWPVEAQTLQIDVGAFRIDGISRCYADAEPGEPLALTGSSGRLEIAIRDGNAADEFQAEFGHRVVVRWKAAQK